jgi:hypothetical protein
MRLVDFDIADGSTWAQSSVQRYRQPGSMQVISNRRLAATSGTVKLRAVRDLLAEHRVVTSACAIPTGPNFIRAARRIGKLMV